MSLLEWFQNLRDPKRTKHYADRLVERYTTAVRNATSQRTLGMSRAEARGYIRSTAMMMVAEAVEGLRKADARLTRVAAEIVLTLAVEQITVAVQESTSRRRSVEKRKAA